MSAPGDSDADGPEAGGPFEELVTRICETPAPTFAEERRAELMASLLRAEGLDPYQDEVGNVVARLPGGKGPRVVVAAHLDTVFGPDVDVRVRRRRGRLYAPGVGDNSSSLAVLVAFVRRALAGAMPRPRLTVAATVGEEGLGDLRGARRLVADQADQMDLFIAVDGHLGSVTDVAVGSRRFEFTLRAGGGHSWGDFPAPSAVHALAEAVRAVARMEVPKQPRSSFNVGQVWGGTSVNAIAEEAGFNLDLRSVDPQVLESLEREALRRIRRAVRFHGVDVEARKVGERPAARVDNRALVAAARRALATVGARPRTLASSTDANVAMAAGLPAIAFGVYRGGDAHRLGEWVDPASLPTGLEALTRLLAELAECG